MVVMGTSVSAVVPNVRFKEVALDLSPEGQKEARHVQTMLVVVCLYYPEYNESKRRGQGQWPEPWRQCVHCMEMR